MQNAAQTIGCNGRFVGERTADTQQDSGKRKHGDWQEQGFTNLLGSGEYNTALFFFHIISSSLFGFCDTYYEYVPKKI